MPAPLDQETADRLLAGRLDPADAPPGYGEVARLLAAASGPPTGDELATEQAVLAAFAARSHTHPPELSQPGRPSRSSGGKAALVVVVALLTIAGVAVAATGRLQQPAPAPAHQAALTSQPRATLSRPSGAASTAASAAAPATTRPPSTTTAATPTSSTPPSSTPLGLQAALANLTQVITTGQRQGTVDPDADDLVDQAREITRAAQTGHGADARDQLDDLQHRTDELITSGKVRGAAVGRLRQALAHFSTAVVLTSRAGNGTDQQEEEDDDDEGADDQEPEDDSDDD